MHDAEAQVVGGLADDGEVEAPFLTKIASAPRPPSRARSTMSMRSWLSDSIIS
jgi:hypothetical protein